MAMWKWRPSSWALGTNTIDLSLAPWQTVFAFAMRRLSIKVRAVNLTASYSSTSGSAATAIGGSTLTGAKEHIIIASEASRHD